MSGHDRPTSADVTFATEPNVHYIVSRGEN